MNIYKAVGEAVSCKDAAERYGLRVEKRGRKYWTVCPFHGDKHASMVLDKRAHCFGCGFDNNVFGFTAQLFGISIQEASKRLAEDFGIAFSTTTTPAERQEWREKQRQREQALRLKETEKRFFRVLTDCIHTLKEWRETLAPKDPATPSEEWDDRFVLAVRELPRLEEMADEWLNAGEDERKEILISNGKEVKSFEQLIKQHEAGISGGDDGTFYSAAG